MSWHFSRAQVAEFLEDTCKAGERSVLLSGTHMPQAYLSPDRMTEFCRLSRYGMTFAPLPEHLGEELLTWYLAGFPAKTSQSLGQEPELTEREAECGQKWQGSLAKYDPDLCLWKTAQHSLLGGWEEFSETWPRWGMTQNGELYQQPIAALSTNGNASGLWQTPVADDSANRKLGKWNSRGEPKLSAQVLFPTPTVCGNYNRKGASATSGDGLATAVAKMWPTATATAYKGWSPNHNRADTDDRLDYSVEREAFEHGQQTPPKRLNPAWVEWLMGFPQGWTDLRPLEMHKFREWLQQHGDY